MWLSGFKYPASCFVLLTILLLVTLIDCRSSRHHLRGQRRRHGENRANTNRHARTSASSDAVQGHTKITNGNASNFSLEMNSTAQESETTPLQSTTVMQTDDLSSGDEFTTKDVFNETMPVTPTSQLKYKAVQTTLGAVRGKLELVRGENLQIYLGIPFGKPTSGQNRFKPPEPASAWHGVRDALDYPATCHQWRDFTFESYREDFRGTAMWNNNTEMSEDCLYLNVWAPAEPASSGVGHAVMVWIYGGGFYSGTSSLDVYDGRWLAATQNVVIVSMNYRIGALGFLFTGHDDIPGNAGLFDQQLALTWVRDNIKYFGGDPSKVTLFGESAGAASVALHMMSEGSQGLFRNVILQSASSLSPWSLITKKEAKRRAVKLAQNVNCLNNNETTAYEYEGSTQQTQTIQNKVNACLRSIDPQELVEKEMYVEDYGTARFPNAAVIDGVFIRESPHNIENASYFNTDVNILAGFNSNEGNYFLVYASPGYNLSTGSKIDDSYFQQGIDRALWSLPGVLDSNMHAQKALSTASHYTYTNGIRPLISTEYESKEQVFIDGGSMEFLDYPLHNSNPNLAGSTSMFGDTFYRDRLDDLVGDINFVCPTIGFLDSVLRREVMKNFSENPEREVFLYKFVHRSSQNPWPEWMGVMHGYEIEFVFGIPLNEMLNYTETEKNISLSMMKKWANFAKYGNPNGELKTGSENEWPTYNESTKHLYVIGNDQETQMNGKYSFLSPVYNYQLRHCSFWKEYFPDMQRNMEAIRKPCVAESSSLPPSGKSTSNCASVWLISLLIANAFLHCSLQ